MRVIIIAPLITNVWLLMGNVVQNPTLPAINVILQRVPKQNPDQKLLAIITIKGQTAVNVVGRDTVIRYQPLHWFLAQLQNHGAQITVQGAQLLTVQDRIQPPV